MFIHNSNITKPEDAIYLRDILFLKEFKQRQQEALPSKISAEERKAQWKTWTNSLYKMQGNVPVSMRTK